MTKQERYEKAMELRAKALAANDHMLGGVLELLVDMNRPSTRTPKAKVDDTPQWAAFDEWYAMYPRREAVGAARTAWAKLSINEWGLAKTGLERQLEAQTFSPDRRFIPLPATWLNQRRWADDVIVDEKKMSDEKKCEKCGKEGYRYRMRGKIKVWRCPEHPWEAA